MEAVTHTKLYLALSPTPRPHPLFRTPLIEDPHTNPYEFEINDADLPEVEKNNTENNEYKARGAEVKQEMTHNESRRMQCTKFTNG